MNKPLLSICIPTYNRKEYLEKCLNAIVKQKSFDDRVEIVISDNCSTDGTQKLCEKYQKDYSNIHYYRNEENMADKNFSLLLQRASGVLRKLTNDTVVYKTNSINYILEAIENNIDERPQLYFKNRGKSGTLRVDSLEDYINSISYHITWIGAIALWEEDCDDLNILTKNSETLLGQVPMLVENFRRHKSAIIYDDIIMEGGRPRPKNVNYGLYRVFYVNFLGFMKSYVDEKCISNKCYEKLRKDLLLSFFAQWVVNYKLNNGEYIFSDENLKELVENTYRKEKYFYKYKLMLIYYGLIVYAQKFKDRIGYGNGHK